MVGARRAAASSSAASVEGVAFAVVESVFADARVGVVSVVHGAVLAEFEQFGVALGFQFFRGELDGFGFGLGVCIFG